MLRQHQFTKVEMVSISHPDANKNRGLNIFACVNVQGYSGHGIALSHIMAEITAKALTGDGREFDMFKDVAHWHMPLSRQMGSGLIALGMLYYKLRDRLT